MNAEKEPTIETLRLPFSSIARDEEIKQLEGKLNEFGYSPQDLHVAIDLSSTFHISSRGLGILVAFNKRVKAKGGEVVVFGATPAVARVMEVTRVNTLIAMADNEAEAHALLQRSGERNNTSA
jgi:anti-anti-sigma factor